MAKYTDRAEVVSDMKNEGLAYFLQSYTDAERMPDEELYIAFNRAKDALDAFEALAKGKGPPCRFNHTRSIGKSTNCQLCGKSLIDSTVLTCVYCGLQYPQGTPSSGADCQVLTDHIKVCEKHPMRTAELRIQLLEAALRVALPHIRVAVDVKAALRAEEQQILDTVNDALLGPVTVADLPKETYVRGPKVALDIWGHDDSRELIDRVQACQQLCRQDSKLVFKTLVDDLAIVNKYTRLVNLAINHKLGKPMRLGQDFPNVHGWPAGYKTTEGDTGSGIRLMSQMYCLDIDAVRAKDGWPNPLDLGAQLAESMLDPGSPNQIIPDHRGCYYWSGMAADFSFEDYFVKFFLHGYYVRFTSLVTRPTETQ